MLVSLGRMQAGGNSTILASNGPIVDQPLNVPTLKEELLTWADAVAHFDDKNYDACLGAFELIAGSAKIHYNMGMVMMGLNNYEAAIAHFENAIQCDSYLAVAYLQRGVCWYVLGGIEEALQDFADAFSNLRSNSVIDYTQLGLDYKLYQCEILYNVALCKYRLGDAQGAANDLNAANRDKAIDDHENISRALAELQQPQPYSKNDEPFEARFLPFQVPEDKIYKPPKSKVDNSRKKDYLGSSKVVAAVNEGDSYTGFSGAKISRRALEPEGEPQEPRQYTSATLTRMGTIGSGGLAGASAVAPVYNTTPRSHAPQPPTANSSTMMRAYTLTRHPTAPMQQSLTLRGSPLFQSSPSIPQYANNSEVSGFAGHHQLNPAMNDQSIMTIGRTPDSITVKCHYGPDIRKIAIHPDVAFESLCTKLRDKFSLSENRSLNIQYRDDDGEMIRMKDDEDWVFALGAPKVEIWLEDQ